MCYKTVSTGATSSRNSAKLPLMDYAAPLLFTADKPRPTDLERSHPKGRFLAK